MSQRWEPIPFNAKALMPHLRSRDPVHWKYTLGIYAAADLVLQPVVPFQLVRETSKTHA